MPIDYKEAIANILELLDYVEKRQSDFSEIDDKKFGLVLEYGSILDNYIEHYGLNDYETSIKAIERITQFTSCEFVTHPFIIKYPDVDIPHKLPLEVIFEKSKKSCNQKRVSPRLFSSG